MRNNRATTDLKLNQYTRFSRYRIVEHWALILFVAILMITGFTARFHDTETLVLIRGGYISMEMINNLHIAVGYITAIFLATHILNAAYGILVKGWQNSMAVTYFDFTSIISDVRYYLGISDQPAKCGRYSYKEKFTYWAILVFGFIMITSGIVLRFPDFAMQFLPAEIIPAAMSTHNNTALLLATVVAWHVYESIFSPESFPLKTTIFTGSISAEEMERDHPLELIDLPSSDKDKGG